MNPPDDTFTAANQRPAYVRAEGLDKFMKELQTYIQPGWEEDYIDYERLKLILKENGGEKEGGVRVNTDKEQLDAEFFPVLENELDKVNEAFVRKCDHFESIVQSYEPHGPQVTVMPRPGQPPVGRVTQEEYWTNFKDLGKMTTYVWINRQGFFKIMKKYDKVCGLVSGRELGPDFERRLDHEVFTGPRLETLIELYKNKKPHAGGARALLLFDPPCARSARQPPLRSAAAPLPFLTVAATPVARGRPLPRRHRLDA